MKLFDWIFPKEDICCNDDLPWNMNNGPDIYAPLLYRGDARKAIHQYKFRGCSSHAGQFARWMMKSLGGVRCEVITWVPGSLWRRWKRGYDHCGLLAKELGRLTGMPVKRLLVRRNGGRPMYKLENAGEREANIKGKYKSKGREDYSSVLLVDDIYTTGATFRECAGILKQNGAEKIILCCIAKK